MKQNSHAAGVSSPLCLDEGAAHAGAVNPRGNAACGYLTDAMRAALAAMPKDYDGDPGKVLEDLGALYREAYARRIAVP